MNKIKEISLIMNYLASNSADVDGIINAVSTLAEIDDSEQTIKYLHEMLVVEENSDIFVSIAIALSKLRATFITPYLIKRIHSEENVGMYSGLFFALRNIPLSCSSCLSDLVGYIITGNWEIRQHVRAIFYNNSASITAIDSQNCINILDKAEQFLNLLPSYNNEDKIFSIDYCRKIVNSATDASLRQM